jgi:hypothetical protein
VSENPIRDFLKSVEAVRVQTVLGPIYLIPGGKAAVQINAPHLTVDGVQLQATAVLVSDGHSFKFDLSQTFDTQTRRFFTGQNALSARLVDGRDADVVTLGKVAQVIVPAVRKFAEENQPLFLEAERRAIHK